MNNLHYGCCTGRLLGQPHDTTPIAVIANKNKTEILKRSEHIIEKETAFCLRLFV